MEARTMTSEAKKKSKAKFDKLNTRFYGIKLNRRTDAEIIQYLDESGNIMGTIRKAMRMYIENEKSCFGHKAQQVSDKTH